MTQYEYKVRRVEHTHIAEVLDEMGAKGWRFREGLPSSSFDVRLIFEREIQHLTPTAISFKESTMNQTQAGQSQVFTGTLSPAGATMPPDATFTIASNDPSVSPSVDSTGLIVSVTYPTGWVESTTTPLAFAYTASSASTNMSLAATITPSAPAIVPTGITFAQTT
jgi:hypothetical protein